MNTVTLTQVVTGAEVSLDQPVPILQVSQGTPSTVTIRQVEAGPAGASGLGDSHKLFVQSNPPAEAGKYMWIQTGLGPDGTGITCWIEDGQ